MTFPACRSLPASSTPLSLSREKLGVTNKFLDHERRLSIHVIWNVASAKKIHQRSNDIECKIENMFPKSSDRLSDLRPTVTDSLREKLTVQEKEAASHSSGPLAVTSTDGSVVETSMFSSLESIGFGQEDLRGNREFIRFEFTSTCET